MRHRPSTRSKPRAIRKPIARPSRRDALKIGMLAAAGASIAATSACARKPAAPANKDGFLTSDELATLDEVSETIIPADAHSPGAKAAKVAAYIDARLAEAFEESERTTWRDGLALIDRISNEIAGRSFVKSSPDQRVAVLTRMAKNEADPKLPEELFFADLKARVVHAYYSSEIGIQQELEYKGNTFLPEFVGHDVS